MQCDAETLTPMRENGMQLMAYARRGWAVLVMSESLIPESPALRPAEAMTTTTTTMKSAAAADRTAGADQRIVRESE